MAPARLLVFALDAKGVSLPPLPPPVSIPPPPPLRATEESVREGQKTYAETCARCHGDRAVGGVKDLRHMTAETHAQFNDIVLGGSRTDKGMASFKDLLTPLQVQAVHTYLIARANEDWQDEATK